jgi:cell division protein FtsW
LGTAAIIVSLTLSIYFICGLPTAQYLMLLLGLPAGAAVLAIQASYRVERLQAWLDPWAYADHTGYQAVQSLLAIGSGGWSGSGMGYGSSKFYYLPEAHTDFSFAILCQEWGFIGAVTVILLFAFLSYTLFKAAALAPDGRGYIIVTGANVLLTGQAMGNIAMVCGLLPVIGVPLPFISYGGTSLISNMALLGVTLNIIRQSRKTTSPAQNAQQRVK